MFLLDYLLTLFLKKLRPKLSIKVWGKPSKAHFMPDIVGNKAKVQISKQVFQEGKAHQIFRKTNISYPLRNLYLRNKGAVDVLISVKIKTQYNK